MARVFTREEFYELVWSKPLTHLAKEFAISDVALHKICRKHDIPNPPLGWRAKKAAGKKVKQTPLPKAKAGSALGSTVDNADLSRGAAALAGVREQARPWFGRLDLKGIDLGRGRRLKPTARKSASLFEFFRSLQGRTSLH